MQTRILRPKYVLLICFFATVAYLAALVWIARDEIPFLHPGKVHVYVVMDEDVADVFLGEHKLASGDGGHSLWLEPGVYELRLSRSGQEYTESVNIRGESYLVLDDEPPYSE